VSSVGTEEAWIKLVKMMQGFYKKMAVLCYCTCALRLLLYYLLQKKKSPIAWWMNCVCAMRFANKLQGNHPVAPRWARACGS